MEGTSMVVSAREAIAKVMPDVAAIRGALQAVFAEFRPDRDALVVEARGVPPAVTDEDAVAVAAKRKEIGRVMKKVDKAGDDFRKPFRDVADVVIASVREFLNPLQEVDTELRKRLEAFEDERRARIAKERDEQRKREEEAARDLAALRAKQEAERAALGGSEGAGSIALELQQAEERQEAERLARESVGPEVTRSVIDGARLGREFVFAIVDPDAIPRAFCSPDPKLVRAKLDTLWKALKDDEARFLAAARQAIPGLDLCCKSKAARG